MRLSMLNSIDRTVQIPLFCAQINPHFDENVKTQQTGKKGNSDPPPFLDRPLFKEKFIHKRKTQTANKFTSSAIFHTPKENHSINIVSFT